MVNITNTAAGPRGLGLTDGSTVLANPGQTVAVDLSAAELAEIEAAGWWQIEAVKPRQAASQESKPVRKGKADA